MNTRKKSWVPPHCPNPNCLYHSGLTPGWTFKRAGFYRRQIHPFRIQRFTCLHCKRSFSSQTFSTTYWQKRPDLDAWILMKVAGCMANRQIARDLNISPAAVDKHVERLGRHCLLFHQRMMQGAEPPTQIVVDGFESFEYSQYFTIHHHVAVEKANDFFIYFTDSPLRRKGRMTEHQKKRRAELEEEIGRPDPKAIEKDMAELIEVALGSTTVATVFSDDHPAYRRSIRRLKQVIKQEVTPGSDHRDKNNSLWEVNLLDQLIRHSSSNHKRETIAWSKRRQASAERLAIFLVWRNYMKGRSEKDRGSPTPAMVKGLTDRPLEVEDILSERIFRTNMELPPRWAEYYDRQVETRALEVNRRHELSYAY